MPQGGARCVNARNGDRALDVPRRALVTGASGFIGANLCRRLLDLGFTVHGISRGEQSAPDVLWHRADATDHVAVRQLMLEVSPDVVYHLASRVTGSSELADVRAILDANLGSAVAVLEAAAEAGCPRVVVAGSDKELGVDGGAPNSPYAAAKLAATGYARMFHQAFGLSIVNLRIFMVYGPGHQETKKLVPHAISSLLAGIAPELTGGVRRFDWIYVDDVVDALIAAAETTAGDDGAPIDVGSGRLMSIREFVQQITDAIGTDVAPRFGALPERQLEPGYPAELARARELLAWEPRTPIEAGIAATVAWYESRMRERL
jgi:UDP-glucose 4-epimerase